MKRPGVRALVLAAGLGTRLRPITDEYPKPLMPFFGPSLLDLALWRCREGGLRHLAINTHHLSEKIQRAVTIQKSWFDDLTISNELEILGTGGAIIPLIPWLNADHLLIYNADIVSDIDLNALVSSHLESGNEATMVLLPNNPSKKTPVWSNQERVVQIGGEARSATEHTFTGVHILSPQFIKRLPDKGFWHIIDTYQEALAESAPIGCYIHHGIWNDLGNPKDYWQALVEYFDNHASHNRDPVGVLAANSAMQAPVKIFFQDGANIKAPCAFARQWIPEEPTGPFSFIFDRNISKSSAAYSHHCLALSGNHFPQKFDATSSAKKIFTSAHIITVE